MYFYFLIAHSYLRWLVVFSLLFGIVFSFIKHKKGVIYTVNHFQLFNVIKNVFNLQFLLGVVLLFQSPFVQSFWKQVSVAVKWRDIRFFGLEHPFMMILSVILINLFVHKSKSKTNTPQGFKYLFIRLLIIFILVFISIPWSFSPFTARPDFRLF